jgi:hypothetical protein
MLEVLAQGKKLLQKLVGRENVFSIMHLRSSQDDFETLRQGALTAI